MNRKILTAAAAACLTVGFGATAAGAAPPAGVGERGVPAGIQCQQAGIGTLQGLGILDDAARDGVYVVDLGTSVPLRDVFELHRTSPELFRTGGVSVQVEIEGEQAVVPATWCNQPMS